MSAGKVGKANHKIYFYYKGIAKLNKYIKTGMSSNMCFDVPVFIKNY